MDHAIAQGVHCWPHTTVLISRQLT